MKNGSLKVDQPKLIYGGHVMPLHMRFDEDVNQICEFQGYQKADNAEFRYINVTEAKRYLSFVITHRDYEIYVEVEATQGNNKGILLVDSLTCSI